MSSLNRLGFFSLPFIVNLLQDALLDRFGDLFGSGVKPVQSHDPKLNEFVRTDVIAFALRKATKEYCPPLTPISHDGAITAHRPCPSRSIRSLMTPPPKSA